MNTKILTLLLALCLVMGLLPATVFAEEAFSVQEQGIDVTAENYTDGEGYSWDADTNTLTLTNLHLVGNGKNQGITLPKGSATIVLIGENKIENFRIGIDQSEGPSLAEMLTITGGGSLSVSNCDYLSGGSINNATLDGISLSGTNKDGLILNGNLTIKNGATVDISVSDATGAAFGAIYANGRVEVSDSTVVCDGNGSYSIFSAGVGHEDYGVFFVNSEITLKSASWGVFVKSDGDVSIKDSTITVESAAGIIIENGTGDGAITVEGNVKMIADSNRNLLRAKEISLNLGEEADFQGYIRTEGGATSFPTDYTLTTDWKVPDGSTLTVPEDVTLTLEEDVTVSLGIGASIVNGGTILVPCDSPDAIPAVSGNQPEKHHIFPAAWESDSATHWRVCVHNDGGREEAAHTYGDWVVTKEATETAEGLKERSCTICGYQETEAIPLLEHVHNYGTEWKSDENSHWRACECGEITEKEAHTFSWVVDKETSTKYEKCSVCGYQKEAVAIPTAGPTVKPPDREEPKADQPAPSGETPADSSVPKTGDSSSIVLYIGLMVASGLAMIGIFIGSQKEKRANR